MQNWSEKCVWWEFETSLFGYVVINRKLSLFPQIFILETTILVKKEFPSILPDIQENLHCVQNRSQKCLWWDFEVSLPGYVAINRKLSPIPQIYTLETTILAKNNSRQFSQISRKSYTVSKICPKNEPSGNLKSHPLAMWQ